MAKAGNKGSDLSAHPVLSGLERSAKRRKKDMKDEDKAAAATALRRLMAASAQDDNQANAKKKPALNKLLKLGQVTKELRRIPI